VTDRVAPPMSVTLATELAALVDGQVAHELVVVR
jgi:hypothetical protein